MKTLEIQKFAVDGLPNWPIVVQEAYWDAVHSGNDDDLQNFLKLRRNWLDTCNGMINSPRVVDKVYEDVYEKDTEETQGSCGPFRP